MEEDKHIYIFKLTMAYYTQQMLKSELVWKAFNYCAGSSFSSVSHKVFSNMEKSCLYVELVAQCNVIF